ncbi:LPXTG cell wall anchor domain-containing protein [Microbacterium sp. SY138]|uniref:LPXTG cell wall anchor domain-containing protein n=1 Tax=Microbacterium sp. SY138 TaxID=3149040 RepID=UPI00321C2C84
MSRTNRPAENQLRRFLLALIAIIGLVGAGLVVPLAAQAAESSLRIDKLVDGLDTQDSLQPGDEFTYTVDLVCDDVDCLNVVLTDTLPAEFAGFQFVGSSYTPSTLPLNVTTTGCVEEGGVPVEVTDDCSVMVVFEQPVDGGVGLEAGGTLKLSVVLRAPLDLPADWAYNGDTVTNTATADWDNGPGDVPATISDTADAVVTIDTVIGVEASKSWSPASQQFDPGATSQITIGAQNQSNIGGDALVIQEPTGAVDGAATLSADNPFRIVDFQGFVSTTLPPDATTVQVDAYVYDEGTGTWSWQTGTPGSVPGLPAGVDPGDVGGIRLTYAGGTIASDATASTGFTVEQRATDRNDESSLATGASVTNSVTSIVNAPGGATASDEATAPYEIGPLTVDVVAGKTITPAELPAGGDAMAELTATNTSNGPVQSLSISDLGFFDAEMLFGGFPSGIPYPDGATAGAITWYIDGVAQPPVPFADGDAPTPPTGTVTGFVIDFTGQIPAGTVATIDVGIEPSLALVSTEAPTHQRTNSIDVTATNDVGTADDAAADDITVYFPQIGVAVDKQITPGGAVEPGNSVVASLTATTETGVAQVDPTQIVVEDSWRDDQADDFWNAFDIVAIAPTQVPPNTTATVEYQRPDGSWATLATVSTGETAQTFQMSRAEFAAALTPPDLPSDVTGIRFTFDNPDGFSQGFSVVPNVVFDARADLRDGSGPTDPRDAPEDEQSAQEPTVYENEASAQSHGEVDGLPEGIDSDVVTDQDTIGVQTPATGEGVGVDANKRWVQTSDKTTDADFLDAQSGAIVSTRNEWRTGTRGIDTLVLTDPATAPDMDPPGAASTVFQAFDLLSIDPVTLADDPLLAWDDITEVWLFVDGVWTPIAAPGGTWMGADGFVGYTLTPAQTAGTTGVRLVYEPDDAARTASTDPTRPEPGSGLATSAVGEYRPTFLTWELRNVVRDDTATGDRWVSADETFNDPDPGIVWNSLRGDWTSAAGNGSDSEQDNITLIDQPPLVSVEKTVTPSSVTIPESADVDPANYPDVMFDIDARNDSTARASYVRVTDPIPCAAGAADQCVSAPGAWADDPFDDAVYDADTNPYERLTVQSLTFAYPVEQVDPAASTVTLWDRATDGTLSTRTLSVTDAGTLTAGDLATVVGVSVVFHGIDPTTEGGSIRAGEDLSVGIVTKVRQYERSDADQLVEPGTVANDVIAQSYDPVLTPSGNASTPSDTANDTVALVSALLDATLAKTIDPESILETQLQDPVTVTLDATDGSSTAATQQVTITDADAAFWNAMQLAPDPALTVVLPAGADQVRIDALVGSTWVEGAFAATAALPTAADPAAIVGLRAVFRNAAGEVFSRNAPPDDWTAQLAFDIVALTTQRDGTDLSLPTTLPNTATVVSERLDGLYADADADADADLTIDPGTHELDVVKSQPGTSHVVSIGASLPWTLQFTNTGTGFLTIDQLVDTLPEYLDWDFSPPTYQTSAGGTLSTDVSALIDDTGKNVTFTWPEGGNRMSPGEVFTITVNLVLAPGLALDEFTTNTFVVTTDEALTACTNASGNGEGTVSGLDDDQCGTTNYVQPSPGGSLAAYKYVKGEVDGDLVDGEVNLNNPDAACPLDPDGYTRTPCAAYTAVGATDDWRLSVVNSGTVGFETVSIVDPLPRIGDRLLATGAARNTTFDPVLLPESLAANILPVGATLTLDVTTSASPCVGTGSSSAWFGDLLCDTTATWVPVRSYAGAWEEVTGIRVTIDFTATAAGSFGPGQVLSLHYETQNVPESPEYPDLAPITVPDAGGFAWNQMGAVGTDAGGREYSVAPVQAGVTLLDGDLGVQKVLAGDTGRAPDSFDFLVECTVAGVPLVLPAGGTLTVSSADDLRTRLDGLPLGSVCRVSETGAVGAFGEGSRLNDGQTVTITTPATGGEPPTSQIAAITNVYLVPPPDPNPDGGGGGLPSTGVDGPAVSLFAGIGILLLLAGGLLVRRRRHGVALT